MLTPDAQTWLVCAVCTAAFAAAVAALWIIPPEERRVPPRGGAPASSPRWARRTWALAEADRLGFLQSPDGALASRRGHEIESFVLDERLLPYAVVFGLERDGWRT
jgi:hypothetical protein